MNSPADEIETAIEVFVRGYCVGKSQTHPYEHRRIGNVWSMQDAPRRNPRDYRKEEWICFNEEPTAVDALARQQTRGRFFVCAMASAAEDDEPLRAEFKRLNYRLLATEPLFVHRLARIPRASSPATIRQVNTAEWAQRFGKASRSRPIPQELLLEGAPFRQYAAVEGEEIVGWVRSVDVDESTWCSNMYVRESHRRRGIGKALLAKMLRDDRAVGRKRSVLLSSHTGALLYPRAGYERIGLLLMFAPKKGP